MENLIRNILKVVFAFCIIVAFLLTMYGAIVLIAMNHIMPAIIVFVFVATVIYWFIKSMEEKISKLELMKSALPNYSDYSLGVMQKILEKGLRVNKADAYLIHIEKESIREVLRYYLNSMA